MSNNTDELEELRAANAALIQSNTDLRRQRNEAKAEAKELVERRKFLEFANQQLTAVLTTAGAPEFDSHQHAFDWATETAQLRAELARVTAERDEATLSFAHEYEAKEDAQRESAALRASVAELEAAISTAARGNQSLAERLDIAEQRVAELEKQLTTTKEGWLYYQKKASLAEENLERYIKDRASFDVAALARAESATPAPHADTVRGWNTGTPDVPVGAMRRIWCAVLADNGKTYHSMLCYANGYAMQLADWADEIPDCCKPIPGDEDNLAWFGWYEESCDHCETQWHSSANVIAWTELPKFDAAMKGGA